jgi:hypothetical protein
MAAFTAHTSNVRIVLSAGELAKVPVNAGGRTSERYGRKTEPLPAVSIIEIKKIGRMRRNQLSIPTAGNPSQRQ